MTGKQQTYSYLEALELSKRDGSTFVSSSGRFFLKWYKWKGWTYHATWTELMARYRREVPD